MSEFGSQQVTAELINIFFYLKKRSKTQASSFITKKKLV
jgi:hypothetical protein